MRPNRDTLYSFAVFDLDAGPVTITLPQAGKRFMSMMVVDQDHYVRGVFMARQPHVQPEGHRHALPFRGGSHLIDPASPQDVKQAHALQDATKVSQKSPGKLELPNWDTTSQKKVRDALLVLNEATLT